MPDIRPFRGLRYVREVAGDIDTLVAPPYDIIYDEWRDRLYDRNPYNIIRLIKSRSETGDSDTANKYTRARDDIESWLDKRVLAYEDRPVLYVLADTFTIGGVERTRFGFIALLRVEEFGNGVYPHERTLSAPKVDRLNLVKATRTNLSQVFSIYRDPEGVVKTEIDTVTATPPTVDFVDEQDIRRRLWVVEDAGAIDRIATAMRDRDIIIADGHHRYETALAYRERMEPERTGETEPFDFVSMYFSPADDDGMAILPTHRKAGDMDGFDVDEFLGKLAEDFEVTPFGGDSLQALLDRIGEDAAAVNEFGLFADGRFYTARYRSMECPKALDVDILHDEIIEKRLGITREDIQNGRRLHFSKSAEHALEDVRAGKDQIAFFMNAMSAEELFRVVLQGRRLPQKSTYFFPKTLSGLVMYRIDGQSLA